MSINTDQLVADIKTAVSGVLERDAAEIRGFSERQLDALALQAKLIASAIVNNEIDDDLRDYFLDSLENMAENFAKSLRGLLAVTIEKVWNAVVGVLWGAIEAATGVSLGVIP